MSRPLTYEELANQKTASNKIITLSWCDADWFDVLQKIGKEVAKLEEELGNLRVEGARADDL